MTAKFIECDADCNGLVSLDEAKAVLLKPPFNFPDEKVTVVYILFVIVSSCAWQVFNKETNHPSCRCRRRCCSLLLATATTAVKETSTAVSYSIVVMCPRNHVVVADHLSYVLSDLTLSIPHFFWLWQKWVYQSVQRHSGLTSFYFLTFGHSGAQSWAPERPNVKKYFKSQGWLD